MQRWHLLNEYKVPFLIKIHSMKRYISLTNIFHLFFVLFNYLEQGFPNFIFKLSLLKKIKRLLPPQTWKLSKITLLKNYHLKRIRLFFLLFIYDLRITSVRVKVFKSPLSCHFTSYWPKPTKIAPVWENLFCLKMGNFCSRRARFIKNKPLVGRN